MLPAVERIPYIILAIIVFTLTAGAQGVTRDINLKAGATVEVINHFGRVDARAEAETDETVTTGKLTASSAKLVLDKEIKVDASSRHATISVLSTEPGKRIDVTLVLPERLNLKVETRAGAVAVAGNFASIEARTDTGTIAVDVPDKELKYSFLWTESRPRYLADFDVSPVKEKAAGKFEIKGRRRADGEVKSKKEKLKKEEPEQDPATDQSALNDKSEEKTGKEQRPKIKDKTSVSLNFTTARGIILLNVPPNEVLSDLRERPLTEAAKAIVRSGDSLLMEAIRRSSPKYFGDYARTLPPLKREPSFAVKPAHTDLPKGAIKTALVRVVDINNRAIPGLEARDFEVLENGNPREIVSVTRSMAPFNLVLLVDVSGSVENYVNFIRKAARNFVDTVGKDDRVSIVIFNEDVKVISKFTTDKDKLSASLDTFDVGGGTAYYDALAYIVSDTLRSLKGERTAIVTLTDGDDNRSFLAFDSLLGSIQESGALIYPLYVPSGLIAAAAANPDADVDPIRKKYMSLSAKSEGEGERLARISGGVYYPISQINQIQTAYEDIVVQMRSAYNITFRSDTAMSGANGASPRLKVKAKRENTFVTVTSIVVAQ